MLNKYEFRVGYSCSSYGTMSGIVYARNREEAAEFIESRQTENESYDDGDSDNYSYNIEDADIELLEGTEEDEDDDENYYGETSKSFSEIPAYYLENILSI